MKKGIMLTIAATALILFTANAQTKETRNVRGFSKVSFGISGELYVDFGSNFNVVLEGDQSALEEIITEVVNDRLVIRRDRDNRSFNNFRKVVVRVTMPELQGLSVSGSGKAEITEAVRSAGDIELSVSGSGSLLASDIVADNINCSISGSGNILIRGKGSTDNGKIAISGSGNYSGEQIEFDRVDIRLSGSGNCVCRVGGELSATVSGSGNVTYIGNPPRVDAKVSGSGKVRSR